jgi:predicted nucleotidyltransferase
MNVLSTEGFKQTSRIISRRCDSHNQSQERFIMETLKVRAVATNFPDTTTLRLTEYEIKTIKQTVLALDNHAKIHLFGSRADSSKKGGDIDLLIFSQKLNYDDKLHIKMQLFEQIGEQKIDIVIAKDTSDPFVRIALKQGVML